MFSKDVINNSNSFLRGAVILCHFSYLNAQAEVTFFLKNLLSSTRHEGLDAGIIRWHSVCHAGCQSR